MQLPTGARRRSLLKPLIIAALCLLTQTSHAAPVQETEMVNAREANPDATPDMDALTDDLSRRDGCDGNAQVGQTVTCHNGQETTTGDAQSKVFTISTNLDTSGGWDAIQAQIANNETAAYLLCIDLLGKSFRQMHMGAYLRNGHKKRDDAGDGRSTKALCASAGLQCDANGDLEGDQSNDEICRQRTGGAPPGDEAASGKEPASKQESFKTQSSSNNDTNTNTGYQTDAERIAADNQRGIDEGKAEAAKEAKRRKKEEAERAQEDADRRAKSEAERAQADKDRAAAAEGQTTGTNSDPNAGAVPVNGTTGQQTEQGQQQQQGQQRSTSQPKRQDYRVAYFRDGSRKRSAGAEAMADFDGARGAAAAEELGKRYDAAEARAAEDAIQLSARRRSVRARSSSSQLRRSAAGAGDVI